MHTLYHQPFSPFSRKIRVILAEKKLPFDLIVEPVWQRRQAFLAMNPAGQVPVLINSKNQVIADSNVIAEYLEETEASPNLLPFDTAGRAETRRLVAWFDDKFNTEVTAPQVGEKLYKRLSGGGPPNSAVVRAGTQNILTHLDYIGHLAERRNWLAGDDFSFADIAAAAHLSAVDYLGGVPWDHNGEARTWYARVKSRPSFRSVLSDHIPGLPPPPHYADLDF
jgi:glutathione S-transferase